jgi:Dolichyl-phosphate-mannose-protein mannosyltransferase
MPADALAVLAVSIALVAAAWRFGRREQTGLSLAAIVATALAVRLLAAAEPTLHEWDEQFHALVAKRLAANPLVPALYDPALLPYDYRNWMANAVWLHKPPVALWLMAGAFRIAGPSELAIRLPSVLLGTLGVVFTFLIARRLFDQRVALLAAAFHAVNGLLVGLVSGRAPVDHVDTALVTVVAAGIWLALREIERPTIGRQALLGAAIGLGLLTKWFPALIVLPVWLLAAIWREAATQRVIARAMTIGAAAALVAGPWAIYIARAFPSEAMWEWRYGLAHSTGALEGHAEGPLFYLAAMPRFFGELVFVPLGVFIWKAVKQPSPARVTTLSWAAIAYLVFSLAATKMPAYVMIAAPAVFIMEAAIWMEWATAFERKRTLAVRVALAVLLVLPARYVLRPGGPFTTERQRPDWVARLQNIDERARSSRAVLFNVPRPIAAMFYLPCTAYSGMPADADLRLVRTAGYTAYIYDEGTGAIREAE